MANSQELVPPKGRLHLSLSVVWKKKTKQAECQREVRFTPKLVVCATYQAWLLVMASQDTPCALLATDVHTCRP